MDDKQLIEALRGIVREETSHLATKEQVETNDRQMRILIENSMSKIENLLREDYGRIAGAAAKVADYDEVKSTVAEHQDALENHNQRLVELEKKAI